MWILFLECEMLHGGRIVPACEAHVEAADIQALANLCMDEFPDGAFCHIESPDGDEYSRWRAALAAA